MTLTITQRKKDVSLRVALRLSYPTGCGLCYYLDISPGVWVAYFEGHMGASANIEDTDMSSTQAVAFLEQSQQACFRQGVDVEFVFPDTVY